MSANSQPLQGRAQPLLPRSQVMRSARYPRNSELPFFLPSLGTKDRSKVAVVRFVTFIQPNCSVVEVEAAALGQSATILEFPQHWGMEGRCSLNSFKGARKTRSCPEEIGMIESCAQGNDGAVTSAADPASPGRFQQAKSLFELPENCDRIEFRKISADQGYDHLRENSLGVQPVNLRPCIKHFFRPFIQNKQQGKSPCSHSLVASRRDDS